MDIELVEIIPAQVEGEGVTTAPVRTLYDILRKLRDGAQVEMELVKNELALRSSRSSFAMPVIKADEFPVMSSSDFGHTFTVPASDLRMLIDRTKFAMSTEETRYYLGGIYLHEAYGETTSVRHLRAVSTDGHRLARVDVPLPDGAAGMEGVIVPRKTVNEVRKLVEGDADVTISVSKTKIRFDVGGAVMTSKVIDGTFPDYSRVIPRGNDKIADVDRGELTAAVDRVSTIDQSRTLAIQMDLGKDGITFSARSPEGGTAVEEVPARYYADSMHVGFNSRYLIDIAGVISDDEMRFILADGGSPALIRGATDESSLFVIMPMRI